MEMTDVDIVSEIKSAKQTTDYNETQKQDTALANKRWKPVLTCDATCRTVNIPTTYH